MTDCIFCKIVSGEIPSYKIYEDENFLAFLEINPINIGHTLVVPKKHYETVYDLPDDLYEGLFNVAKTVAPRIKEVTGFSKIALSVVGLDVKHAHLHVLPINSIEDTCFKNQKPANQTNLAEIAEKLR